MRLPLALAIVASTSGVGCIRTADVVQWDGYTYTGEVVGSDHETIWIEVAGTEVRVPRSAIRDIDHPGNVALTLGAAGSVVSTGALLAGALLDDADGSDRGSILYPGLLGLAIYLPFAIWGFEAWTTSVGHARRPRRPAAAVHVAPTGLQVRF